jgi:hypothetical protein
MNTSAATLKRRTIPRILTHFFSALKPGLCSRAK